MSPLRHLLLVAAIVIGLSTALAQESSNRAVSDVRAATQAFYAALNRADAVAADRYLLRGGDSFPRNGKALDPEAPTEQESLQNLTRSFAAGLRFKVTLRDLQIKAHGDTAVATFYTEGATTTADHSASEGIYRDKIAHFHISPLQP